MPLQINQSNPFDKDLEKIKMEMDKSKQQAKMQRSQEIDKLVDTVSNKLRHDKQEKLQDIKNDDLDKTLKEIQSSAQQLMSLWGE